MQISSREKEVLELIAREFSTREIAEKLYISFNTAHSHRKNILLKLGVRNAAGMVRKAFELGILTLQPRNERSSQSQAFSIVSVSV